MICIHSINPLLAAFITALSALIPQALSCAAGLGVHNKLLRARVTVSSAGHTTSAVLRKLQSTHLVADTPCMQHTKNASEGELGDTATNKWLRHAAWQFPQQVHIPAALVGNAETKYHA
jgi:hypothetical protein